MSIFTDEESKVHRPAVVCPRWWEKESDAGVGRSGSGPGCAVLLLCGLGTGDFLLGLHV